MNEKSNECHHKCHIDIHYSILFFLIYDNMKMVFRCKTYHANIDMVRQYRSDILIQKYDCNKLYVPIEYNLIGMSI